MFDMGWAERIFQTVANPGELDEFFCESVVLQLNCTLGTGAYWKDMSLHILIWWQFLGGPVGPH